MTKAPLERHRTLKADIIQWAKYFLADKITTLSNPTYGNTNKLNLIRQKLLSSDTITIEQAIETAKEAWRLGVDGIPTYYTPMPEIVTIILQMDTKRLIDLDYDTLVRRINDTFKGADRIRISRNLKAFLLFITKYNEEGVVLAEKLKRGSAQKVGKIMHFYAPHDFFNRKEIQSIERACATQVAKTKSDREDMLRLFIIRILIYSGIKSGEVAKLKGEDFYMEDKQLLLKIKGESERTIPLPRDRFSSLVYNIMQDREIALKDYIFSEDEQAKISHFLKAHIHEALALSQIHIASQTAETFRNSFGIALHREGVPIERIRELMGHAGIQATKTIIKKSIRPMNANITRLLGAYA